MGFVYKITCIPSGKSYIGISIHDPENGRIKDHLSGHGNQLVARAIKKYGKESFTYEILEENVFPAFLPELEVFYIAKLNTVAENGYNLTTGGEIGKSPSEETREKYSGVNHHNYGNPAWNRGVSPSEETRRKQSCIMKGRKLSKDHIEKVRISSTGRKHTEESKLLISESKKGEKNPQFGKPPWNKGKTSQNKGVPLSDKTCEKISITKSHPLRDYAYNTYLSLSYLPIKQNRKRLYEKFHIVKPNTIWNWTRKWQSEI